MSDRVQFRRDTKARWIEVNPILMEGEIGLEIDTNNIKQENKKAGEKYHAGYAMSGKRRIKQQNRL